jgi:hypothetical protein
MSEESTAEERSDDDPFRPAFLTTIRTEPRKRYAALVGLLVVGLAAAWVHWLGLFVAGALVGLVSRTVPRAVAAGLGVGVAALVLTVLASPTMGVGEFLALTPPAYVAIGSGLVLPVWGSLVRAVV